MKTLLFVLVMGLVAAPAYAQTYYVYATAESEDEVALIAFDGTNATVAETIVVGSWPAEIEGAHGLTVGLDGEHWYLTLAHGTPYGTLYKYATATNEIVGEVELGLFPATMSISPATGLLYAVNFNLHGKMEPSTVSVVEPTTMTEIAQIETGMMPHGSRVSPDGTKHYSAAMMSGTLYEIDAQSLEVARTLFTGEGEPPAMMHGDMEGMSGMDRSQMDHSAMNHGSMASMGSSADHPAPKPTWVDPHPSQPLVYVANNGSDQIAEVNTETWAVTRRFATAKGPYNLAVTPDGTRMVVTHKGAASIGIWDLEAGTELAQLPTTRTVTHGVVISPDNRYAFVTSEGVGAEPGAVDVYDIAALKHVDVVEIGKQAGGIAFWKIAQ
ncbi:MAG: YncE family protein [Bacteroidota bacterium]